MSADVLGELGRDPSYSHKPGITVGQESPAPSDTTQGDELPGITG